MESDNVKTPAEIADEARQTARDAVQAAQGYARESGRIGRDAVHSIRANAEDAMETAAQAADTVAGLAGDARDIGKDATATAKAYAKDAVNASGRRIRDLRGRVEDAKANCAQYIAEQPARASLIAAAAGAITMSLLVMLVKGRRSY